MLFGGAFINVGGIITSIILLFLAIAVRIAWLKYKDWKKGNGR